MISPVTSPEPSADNNYYHDHLVSLMSSFTRWTGRSLLHTNMLANGNWPRVLYEAPFVLLSHDTQHDPIFTYGNRTAQHLLAVSWNELVNMPSRYSAEAATQAERDQLLARAHQHGYVEDYSGVRIAKSGQRFYIAKAIVWNIIDDHNTLLGQAAYFDKWLPILDPVS